MPFPERVDGVWASAGGVIGRAGAIGYIVKGTPADEILSTIHRAIMGQASLSTEVTGEVIQELVMLLERSEEMAAD